MPKTETYLGDGVYAVYEGYEGQTEFRITIDLRGQDDTTVIVLESEVLARLADFDVDQQLARAAEEGR